MNAKNFDQFLLTPRERATYGATVTCRDLETGKTRTIARTQVTAIEALRAIVEELDGLPGDWRVLCISTPVTIGRDLYASRIVLKGPEEGAIGAPPETIMLAKIHRLDRLHPPLGDRPMAPYHGPTHRYSGQKR